MDISKLKLHELEELQSDVEDRIREVKYQEWKSKKHTKEEIVAMFESWGCIVPKGVKIWRVHPHNDVKEGAYGMEVGKYTHSCHIDSTDLLVLLVTEGDKNYTESFAEHWLSDPITV